MQRLLADGRPWIIASLIAAVAFFLIKDGTAPLAARMAIKGAAVGLLAIHAFLRGSEARTLGAYLALGALGDMVIERNLEAGAACFLAGHIVALAFYLRNRREQSSPSQKAMAVALLALTPLIAWSLPADRAVAWPVATYAITLGGMAASAWMSRFSRYTVGIGAVLFVVSDLLIFARTGPLAASRAPGLLIWPLYYYGQYLICLGVLRALRQPAA